MLQGLDETRCALDRCPNTLLHAAHAVCRGRRGQSLITVRGIARCIDLKWNGRGFTAAKATVQATVVVARAIAVVREQW